MNEGKTDFPSEEKNEFFMDESNTITDQDNHIYFYSDVNKETVYKLNDCPKKKI